MSDDAIRLNVNGQEISIPPPFTNRELHLIKQIADVRAGEFADALQRGDSDVLVALAHIGLRRVGAVRPTLEELWDMPATAITATQRDLEQPDPTTAVDGGANGNGNPATPQSGDGSPPTDTSSTLHPAISQT